MLIDLDTLHRLIAGQVRILAVGRIPDEVQRYFRSTTQTVFLSADSALHILQQHSDHLEVPELLKIPTAIDRGLWIPDRETSCCLSYFDDKEFIRYIGAVKVTKRRHELYLSTFHRGANRQTKALLRRGKLLRAHL